VCDTAGKPVLHLPVSAGESEWGQFLMKGGREIWVIDYATRKVSRYAMPPAG